MSGLFNTLHRNAQEKSTHPALNDGQICLSYGELPTAISHRAALLKDYRSRILALDLDNSVDWIIWDLAALQANVVCVPLAPFFSPAQRQFILQNAGVDTLVDHSGLQKYTASPVHLPAATAKITYTSGTTGAPKGVCLSRDALEQVAQSIVTMLGADYGERHLAVLPLAVLLENVAGVYAALWAGATVYLPSLSQLGPEPGKLWQCITETHATTAIMVPELLHSLLDSGVISAFPSALRFLAVGGAKVAPDLIQRARAVGLPVYEGYGLSECASVVALNTPAADRPGTVGKLLPHINARIEEGEVVIDPPPFLGYVGETPSACFATGDLGFFDEQAYLVISGRKKNVLITSYGRNISPEWVESVLQNQPAIRQALVYGDGEACLSALLVPASSTPVESALSEAVATANSALPDYARIGQWRSVNPFTMSNGFATAAGKLRRHLILDFYCINNW